MITIVVTGVAGFLGSHLADKNILEGNFVIGIDDFSSSSSSSQHLQKLKKHKNFYFIEGSIDIQGDWYYKLINHVNKIDIIYNFACPASPPRYQAMPVKTMMTCVVGTRNMLDIAKKFNSVIVQASTSEVYGNPDISPQNEKYLGNVNCYGPRSNYDEGKRAAEALCYDYLQCYNTDARIVRIFNTYGPHMDPTDGRVVSNLICQALKNEPLTVYGDGTQTRSFCYVSDLITAIMSMAKLPSNPNTPINIGNPIEHTVLELTEKIVELTKSDSEIIFKSLPIDDPTIRKPDITNAYNILNMTLDVGLTEGLLKTIAYFKARI